MKTAGYIVTKGGRPCALVPIPAARSGVLIFGEEAALFASDSAATAAITLSLARVAQLRGAKLAATVREKRRAVADARLFAVVPVRREGGR